MSSNVPKKPGAPSAIAGTSGSPPSLPESPTSDSVGHQDVVLATGVTSDRKGVRVIRARNQQLEVGEVRPLEAGKPLTGDVVRLKPRPDFPLVCDVETDFSREELRQAQRSATSPSTPMAGAGPSRRTAGPPQVASQAYRDNWDTIYRRTSPGSSEMN